MQHCSKYQTRLLLFGIFLLNSITLFAKSDIIVKATLDTNQIRIGEQVKLDLTATTKANTEVTFPILPDTFNNIELVQRGPIDTVKNVSPLTLHQSYLITSFDSGFFVIPPLPFLTREIRQPATDTVWTEAMLLGVRTIPVDTTKEIKDIKATMSPPFPWMEYLPWLIAGWVVLLIIIYFVYRLTRKKKKAEVKVEAPKRPPHIIALEKLAKIESEKLWQNGQMKQYHSGVADTIREYIEYRFRINALEQTTDELLRNFGHSLLTEGEKSKLHYILTLADMVKFAKAEPVMTENEQSMRYAVDFVNATIPLENAVPANKEVNA